MRATPPGNEIIRLSIPALLSEEGRYGFSKSFLHINDGPVLVKRQHFDFAPKNVMHFPHGSLRLLMGMPNAQDLCSIILLIWRMSVLGQKKTCAAQQPMSAMGQ